MFAMSKPSESQQASGSRAKEVRKHPYRSPRLTEYGNLKKLALAKGGGKNDGFGKPKSRV
jgi:hypothetical protein